MISILYFNYLQYIYIIYNIYMYYITGRYENTSQGHDYLEMSDIPLEEEYETNLYENANMVNFDIETFAISIDDLQKVVSQREDPDNRQYLEEFQVIKVLVK